MVADNSQNLIRQSEMLRVRAEFKTAARMIRRRFKRGLVSERKLAKSAGISRPMLKEILNNPEKIPSRKTMMKVVKNVNPKPRKKKRIQAARCYVWHTPDAV